jgi:hypothetical protein
MDRRQERILKILVIDAKRRLEGRDHVADDIFRRIMEKRRHPFGPVEIEIEMRGYALDQQRMLGDRKSVGALGLAVPARHPCKPMRDIFDLDVERRGVEEIEPSPGQHALPGARRFPHSRHGIHRASFATAS